MSASCLDAGAQSPASAAPIQPEISTTVAEKSGREKTVGTLAQ